MSNVGWSPLYTVSSERWSGGEQLRHRESRGPAVERAVREWQGQAEQTQEGAQSPEVEVPKDQEHKALQDCQARENEKSSVVKEL